VFFQDPGLNRRYPDGVYINLHAYPDFSSYAARRASFPTTGDMGRDIKLANRLFQQGSDPMWRGVPAGATPRGWVWHHVQGGRRMILIPRSIHRVIRHAGGIATGPTIP
jgi:hypothetical protein